jgi:Uma2 family endonuclease
VATARREPGRFIELEGAPDLVVEILSDSSERKDTEILPDRYARAGVPELWLLDARGEALRFSTFTLEHGSYRQGEPDAGGWIFSPLLGARCRITREPAPHEGWLYALDRRRGR